MTRMPFARLAAITALIAVLVLSSAAPASAARGGAHKAAPTGSFSLVLLDSPDTLPNYGEHVTFTVTSTAAYPMVRLTCSQQGEWVTNQTVGFYPGWPWSQVFPLSSWKWTGGAADCDAVLYYQTRHQGDQILATMSFHVEA
jgi:hypothetical protein